MFRLLINEYNYDIFAICIFSCYFAMIDSVLQYFIKPSWLHILVIVTIMPFNLNLVNAFFYTTVLHYFIKLSWLHILVIVTIVTFNLKILSIQFFLHYQLFVLSNVCCCSHYYLADTSNYMPLSVFFSVIYHIQI